MSSPNDKKREGEPLQISAKVWNKLLDLLNKKSAARILDAGV